MANTLTPIMAKILARALMALRTQAIMTRIVNFDYSDQAAAYGASINVPIPSALTATDVIPGPTPPAPTDAAPTTVTIDLNNWKKVNFHLTDKDMMEIDRNAAFLPMETSEAVQSIAAAINQSVYAEYKGIYGYVGPASGPNSTPFASDATAAINARKVLHKQRAPRDNRRGVLDYDAEANALGLQTFADAEKVGSSVVKIEGEIGRKYGIDWFSDDDVPSHTAGTLSNGTTHSALVNQAGNLAAGSTTVNLDSTTLTGTIVKGDVFSVAGDNNTYVVTNASTLTASGNAINGVTFDPPSAVVWADNAVVTFRDTHRVNLAFHRDAFALAMRPMADRLREMSGPNDMLTMTDPQTGLSLRLEIIRQYKQTMWEFDALWGTKLVRPALAVRIAG